MKFSQSNRACMKLVLMASVLMAGAAHAATTPEVVQAASGVATKAPTRVNTGTGKAVPKVTGTAGTITSKGDDSQYPSGTIPVPPKPKKEGLEQTPAIKANVKAAP